jgi:hypothetical protein
MLRSRNGTAVNDILRAGDGGGAGRGEKGDEVRHFFRLSRASDQNADRRLIIRKIVPAIRRAGRAPGLISANICFLSWLRIENSLFSFTGHPCFVNRAATTEMIASDRLHVIKSHEQQQSSLPPFLWATVKRKKIWGTTIVERLNFVPSAIDLEVELGVCAIARKLPTRRPPAA